MERTLGSGLAGGIGLWLAWLLLVGGILGPELWSRHAEASVHPSRPWYAMSQIYILPGQGLE